MFLSRNIWQHCFSRLLLPCLHRKQGNKVFIKWTKYRKEEIYPPTHRIRHDWVAYLNAQHDWVTFPIKNIINVTKTRNCEMLPLPFKQAICLEKIYPFLCIQRYLHNLFYPFGSIHRFLGYICYIATIYSYDMTEWHTWSLHTTWLSDSDILEAFIRHDWVTYLKPNYLKEN